MICSVHVYDLIFFKRWFNTIAFPWSIAKSADWSYSIRIVIVWLHIIILSQKSLPPRYLLNTGGLYDSGFGLNKGLPIVYTVPTYVYEIDLLTPCVVILYKYLDCTQNVIGMCFSNSDSLWKESMIILAKSGKNIGLNPVRQQNHSPEPTKIVDAFSRVQWVNMLLMTINHCGLHQILNISFLLKYRQVSNIRRPLVGN